MIKYVFTLIAYKPNSYAYYRYCLMEAYSSDLIVKVSESEEDITKAIYEVLLKNKNLMNREDGYEINILINGRYPGDYYNCDTWEYGPEFIIANNILLNAQQIIEKDSS